MADKQTVDAILLNGGDIRGSKEYRDDEYFSLGIH